MAEAALGIYLVYLALAFGLRSLLQHRRTGTTGFNGIGGRPGSAEWVAGAGFAVAIVLGLLAPILTLTGVLDPVKALDGGLANGIGVVLALVGLAGTLFAQVAMGRSWRIGVDPDERTELVTDGPFALVRNPIFSAMIPTALGLTLMVPNLAALLGFAGLVVALELQVRVVEEPYLLRAHGREYTEYSRRVGRFVPGIGLLAGNSPPRKAG